MDRNNERLVVVVEFEDSPNWLTAQEARAITNAKRQEDVDRCFPW